ncbi:hypothetical protein KP509_06G063900 [Ceratopteris richardii]|uniref:Integrase catalytic domain-containing protein n=1 Tax=Ceratopteris richardii TaxID=49495 RepID=A0A8T2UPF0_CERRI|nr:hypothetical protein KP509_06G063900 [Ceratopteris richardii]
MKYKIFHKKSCAYYPRANGQAESTNKVLISLLRKMCYLHPLTWGTTYLGVVWAYKTAFKVTTKHTPFQLVYGLEAIAPLEFLKGSSRVGHPRIDNLQVMSNINMNRLHQLEEKRTIADSTLEKGKMKRKAWHDRNLCKTEIKEGSLVLLYQPSF